MYEYAPNFLKRKEKQVTYGLFGIGAVLFVASSIAGFPIPWLFQILGLVALGGAIYIYSACITRTYVYRVEDRDRMTPDLIITERVGKRVQIVCRISLSSVQGVYPVSKETKRTLEKRRAGRQYFSYTGVLFDGEQYYIEAEECDVPLLLRVCADETLLSFLGGIKTL